MSAGPLIAITIARQLAAGGAPLGKRLAGRLGFTYLDDEIMRLAAERSGAELHELKRWDEHRARFWERLGQTFNIGAPDGVYTPLNVGAVIHDREVFELQAQVIRDAASRENCIIIGRAGFWILRDHPGRLSVYLHAPPAARVGQVMELFKVDEAEARRLIDQVDGDRARFVRETTGGPIAPASQHLCIDTSRVSLETAEGMVVLAVEALRRQLGTAA